MVKTSVYKAGVKMQVIGFAPLGFEGELVRIEVDIRRGIPGIDVVGLPDGAVKEAKERVRIAIRNSGFQFPQERILINLSPAGFRKEGAAFDLPIAIAILLASGQMANDSDVRIMIIGELQLSGCVRPVNGVLSAVACGIKDGITHFLVPRENVLEALALHSGNVAGIAYLSEAVSRLTRMEGFASCATECPKPVCKTEPDFSDMKGQAFVKRALEIAAAGMHNVLLFGPPGSGKTMAARRFVSLLPDLSWEDAVAVTKIYSLAGILPKEQGLMWRPPFRMPHHSASLEGIIGGGKFMRPGEVSLSHKGVLFLDETPEFRKGALQSLREPIEEGRVALARAGKHAFFPADFQLIMTANPCPCGNMGRDDHACLCSMRDVQNYWKRIGGALMDRIDIRIPVLPVSVETMLQAETVSSAAMRGRIEQAVLKQSKRYDGLPFRRNSRIPPGMLDAYVPLDTSTREVFAKAVHAFKLSSRACHSIIKIARTIADLGESDSVCKEHLLEAIQHRRYGDKDFFWNAAYF